MIHIYSTGWSHQVHKTTCVYIYCTTSSTRARHFIKIFLANNPLSSLCWRYSLYRTLRLTVTLRFYLLFSLAPLSLIMQNSCSFLVNDTCDYFSHSVRDSQNHTSLLYHLKFWKCKSCDYGYCCLVAQPITLCTSTLKISICLVTAY